MRTGIFLSYADGFRDAVEDVVELEKVGVDIALVAEAYSYDAISQLGYLAANHDVAAANLNPLDHFLQHGVYEGRAAINDGAWH